MTIVLVGVADCLAVIRKAVCRFDWGGKGAVVHEGGELAVVADDGFPRRVGQPTVQPKAVNTHPAEDEIDDRDDQGLSVTGGVADDGAAVIQEGGELRRSTP